MCSDNIEAMINTGLGVVIEIMYADGRVECLAQSKRSVNGNDDSNEHKTLPSPPCLPKSVFGIEVFKYRICVINCSIARFTVIVRKT